MKLILILCCLYFISHSTICDTCIQVTQFLQNTILSIAPQSFVQNAVELVCEKQYGSERLCKQVSEQLTPLAMNSGVKALLKEGRICQSFCGKKFYSTFNMNDIQNSLNNVNFDIEKWIPQYQKIVLQTNDLTNLRILHLTDIHLDLNYTQKSSTSCDMPICCHIEDGFPTTQTVQAKPLGSIKCDTPIKLLDKTLDYIQQNITQIDVVIVTGDYSAHNEWQKTNETVKYVRNLVEDKIKSKVKTQNIFTAPGNNEYLPDHQVDPSSVPQESLKVYRVYQSDEQNFMTFVSINTLFCDNINLYLVQDQTGSIRQLKMLERILEENENVYLFGHIGLTSTSCAETYSLIFRTILNKYKHKILGQFYGHTHLDQFMVNTNPKNNSEVTSFSLSAGSLSPLNTGTSRFRVYELNSESYKIQNYLDYEMFLNHDNFELNYQFKDFYNVSAKQFSAQSMRQFQKRLQSDADLRIKYAGQLNGKKFGNNSNAYCQTYDDKQAVSKCLSGQSSLSMDINKYLQLIQGPWGSYGQNVQ